MLRVHDEQRERIERFRQMLGGPAAAAPTNGKAAGSGASSTTATAAAAGHRRLGVCIKAATAHVRVASECIGASAAAAGGDAGGVTAGLLAELQRQVTAFRSHCSKHGL